MTGYRFAFTLSRALALYFFGTFVLGLNSVVYLWDSFRIARQTPGNSPFLEMAFPAMISGIASLLMFAFCIVLWFYADAIAKMIVVNGDQAVGVSGQTLWAVGLKLVGLYFLITYGSEAVVHVAINSQNEVTSPIRFFICIGFVIAGIICLIPGISVRTLVEKNPFRAEIEPEHK